MEGRGITDWNENEVDNSKIYSLRMNTNGNWNVRRGLNMRRLEKMEIELEGSLGRVATAIALEDILVSMVAHVDLMKSLVHEANATVRALESAIGGFYIWRDGRAV